MIRVGVLTSSRADYGIYLPLLKAIKNDSDFELRLIVFGTHLSKFHGYTLKEIELDGFVPYATLESLLVGDTPNAISSTFGLTNLKFADFWNYHRNEFDVVFALGDRFEMAAAVIAAIPYGIKFAHFHGGETTLEAIDNVYRHSITLASKWHLVATEDYKARVKELVGTNDKCIVSGSLSLVNLQQMELISLDRFHQKWGIDLSIPSMLISLHPETVAYNKNEKFASEAQVAFKTLCNDFQLIITMPNADTSGTILRKTYQVLKDSRPERIFLIENFGTQSFFSCMKNVGLIVGNSSSGIIEAASFGKYVINIGDRQKGRLTSENIIHVPFYSERIIQSVKQNYGKCFTGKNIYYQKDTVQKIMDFLKRQL
jgi:GDP/UDP-N,N'-diacetylbacillosamine 2-epimerase (hydrolysing)